jgi:hypothetical protein
MGKNENEVEKRINRRGQGIWIIGRIRGKRKGVELRGERIRG